MSLLLDPIIDASNVTTAIAGVIVSAGLLSIALALRFLWLIRREDRDAPR